MTEPLPNSLSSALMQSAQLMLRVRSAWAEASIEDTPPCQAAAGLCRVSVDHGSAVQAVIHQWPASAIALLRPQYEALVRAVWAAHAASPADLQRLLVPLTPQSQQAAKQLPGIPQMLAALENSGPRGAAALLARARSQLNDGLNSFVHGGIHPFARQRDGYPEGLLLDVLKNSNALAMLSLIMLGTLSDDAQVLELLPTLHLRFKAVLPALEPLQAASPT